jgi:hypothetical protein
VVEVGNVSPHGFWLLLDGQEVFLSFEVFPWFREASIRELCNIERPRPGHLWWPDLDVDLDEESIEHPEEFPLVSRRRPEKRTAAPRKRRARTTNRSARG